MLTTNNTSISAQAKRLIGTFQRLSVDVVKSLIKLVEHREISTREIRILAASWYVHTLYSKVDAESARRSLGRHFTLAQIAETQTRFKEWIDPDIRHNSRDIRRIPRKLCLELAHTTSILEQGIILLTVSQGSLTKQFTFVLGQNYLAAKFRVAHQSVAEALASLCTKGILIRSTRKYAGAYRYRYGPKIKPDVSQ